MPDKKKNIDKNKVDQAIKMGVPVTVTTYTLPQNVQSYIKETIDYMLSQLNQKEIKDYILYCFNELAINAKKANTKRVYFQEHELDIFDPNDYKKGIVGFKSDTLENIDHYLKLQKEEGLYIKISLQQIGQNIKLEIKNNVKITKEELDRVHEKIALANKYTDITEVFTQIVDETEGAGLGLIIMMLMLKKIGAKRDAYTINLVNDETVSTVILPFDSDFKAQFKQLTNTVVNHIEKIPQFSEKILQLQKLINDPDAKISDIAKNISDDVGLTADLLKFVNSASFGLKVKCINIAEAVKLVGLRGLQNLLYSVGTVNILENGKSTEEQKKLWANAYKVAYFSYNLAKILRERTVIDDAYVCGLLHDLGKIVFSGIYPNLLDELYESQSEKKIPKSIIDMVTSGIQHEEIGATLTEKWTFPPQITAAIRYQHDVSNVPEEFKSVTSTVAMADLMIHYYSGLVSYDQIPKELLSLFNIDSETMFAKLCETFEVGFSNQQ